MSNPGGVTDTVAPTVNSSRIVVFDKTTGLINGIADGTAGQFLQTNGAGILSWVSGGGGGAVDIDGLADGYKVGTRLVLGSTVTPTTNNTTIISPIYSSTGTGDFNIFIGTINTPSITSGGTNTIISPNTFANLSVAAGNIIIGAACGTSLSTGGTNTIIGTASGNAITSGSNNTIIGSTCGVGITTQSNNVIIGYSNSVSGGVDSVAIVGTNINANINNGFYIRPATAIVTAPRPIVMNTTTGQIGPVPVSTTQTITGNGQAILIDTGIVKIISFTNAYTGITFSPGTYIGQILIIAIASTATNSITLDITPGTSLVYNSANAAVNLLDAADATTNRTRMYVWDGTFWIPMVA